MTAIETKNLCKRYGSKTVVDHLNLSIEEGTLFALLGVNGAGKSTTIKLLSCLVRPSEGTANVRGLDVQTQREKVKQQINVSPQETAIAPNLSVRENLALIAGIYGSRKEEAQQRAEEMIREFSLELIAKDKARTLSGGWQRRLSIAMALITFPRVLFLDEPTLGLDVLARRELWQLIRQLKGKVTIILTTHYLEEAAALADQIGVMAGGRLKAVGTAEQLIAQTNTQNFEDAFISLALEGGQPV